MTADYYEIARTRIGHDLTSFADPGSVKTEDRRRTFFAEWKMRGEAQEAKFNVSPDHGVTVQVGQEKQPYGAFLASTQMADLRHMAQMIVQLWAQDVFVPTKARRTDNGIHDPRPATELLTDLIEDDELEVTQVIMVTGEAGAGKTQVLQRLVSQQAERYLKGETRKLLLYVNAQGRALARLNEALATELQDLRVNLTYHSVATLTRVGLLVPVIDGFDELLGVSGYDDAFNSLSVFLGQLEGEGRLIASARSVYYEEEFLSRENRFSNTGILGWSHVPVMIEGWNESDRTIFLEQLAERQSLSQERRRTLEGHVKDAFGENRQLASKPLFFVKTVTLLLDDPEFSGSGDLLDTLTFRFLERERQEKLLDRQQAPLLSKDEMELLMSELAEEMWNQETRELDRDSVRDVAEYVLQSKGLPESTQQVVTERMPTLAFLARSEKHANFQFEHEIFFSYFLAKAMATRFSQSKDMRLILSRSGLPEFVADRLAFELQKKGKLSTLENMQDSFDRLAEVSRYEWRRTTQVRENAGLIVMALLRRFAGQSSVNSEIVDRTISAVVFPGSELRNVTLRRCTLADVEIRRTDLGSAYFIDCHANNAVLVEPRVKVGSTRLELKGLRVPEQVLGVQKLGDGGNNKIYDPGEIAHVLRECGTPDVTVVTNDRHHIASELREPLEKLMRAYERANIVCDGDQNLGTLFTHTGWPKLRNLLVEHGIVREEHRSTSGPSKTFFRRQFAPGEIMNGESRRNDAKPQITRFWEALGNTPV